MDWLSHFWTTLTWGKILLGATLFLASFALSILIVAIVMVKIPANYFSTHYQRKFLPNTPFLVRWGAVVSKNIVGFLLIIAGIVMLIGPGQGILTILIGLMMMDIPGKRPLEAKLIQRPAILSAVNNLRARYNKSPLLMD
ncbi:MAG: hypothetical protein H0U87_10780 [Acidobacteria bacterium]|jgi:hypothetical protein|nr:hypothetical protein [Acidobacteriota bacterium]